MDKKGDYMYGILLYLILGVLVLVISIFFIYQEFWVGDEGSKEVCWQSIQLRAPLPDSGLGADELEFKSSFPLKCKTMVVEVSEADVRNVEVAQEKIAESMAECWNLYGNGDLNVFPAKFFKSSVCVPCARIHFTDEAKKYARDNKVEINIKDALDLKMKEGFTYYSYLQDSGKSFSALNFGNAVPFNLNGEDFSVESKKWDWASVDLVNRANGVTFEAKMSSINVSLPERFNIDEGDLMINYGVVAGIQLVVGESKGFGEYVPYLFYFQSGQKDDSFKEVQNNFIFSPSASFWEFLQLKNWIEYEKRIDEIESASVGFCDEWEGIPG